MCVGKERERGSDKGERKSEMEVVCCIYGVSLGEGGSYFWIHFSLIQLLLSLLAALSQPPPPPRLFQTRPDSEGQGGARHTSQDVTLHPALCMPSWIFNFLSLVFLQLACLFFLPGVKSFTFNCLAGPLLFNIFPWTLNESTLNIQLKTMTIIVNIQNFLFPLQVSV